MTRTPHLFIILIAVLSLFTFACKGGGAGADKKAAVKGGAASKDALAKAAFEGLKNKKPADLTKIMVTSDNMKSQCPGFASKDAFVKVATKDIKKMPPELLEKMGGEKGFKKAVAEGYDEALKESSPEGLKKTIQKGLEKCKDIDFSKAAMGKIKGGELDQKKTDRKVKPLCGDAVKAHEDIKLKFTVGEAKYEVKVEDVMVMGGKWFAGSAKCKVDD